MIISFFQTNFVKTGYVYFFFRDTFMEIFYRCDLDGNGYLSPEEFNEFQLRTSGEKCDGEAWDVVKGTNESTSQKRYKQALVFIYCNM